MLSRRSLFVFLCTVAMPFFACQVHALETKLDPEKYFGGDYPFEIYVDYSGSMVEFRIVGRPDGYSGEVGMTGFLEVRNGRNLLASSIVGARSSWLGTEGTEDLLVLEFSVHEDFLASSLFRFRFDRYYQLHLDEWAYSSDDFTVNLILKNRVVEQGDLAIGELRILAHRPLDLRFSCMCTTAFEITTSQGEVITNEGGLCSPAGTEIRIASGAEKSMYVETPTKFGSEIYRSSMYPGELPVGEYVATWFVKGYRHLGLEASTGFSVVERK